MSFDPSTMMARKCSHQITSRCGSAATSSSSCPQKLVIKPPIMRIRIHVWLFEVRNFVPTWPRFVTCERAGSNSLGAGKSTSQTGMQMLELDHWCGGFEVSIRLSRAGTSNFEAALKSRGCWSFFDSEVHTGIRRDSLRTSESEL